MISPLSYIHPEARLGANVTVSQFASVYEGVTIGEGTWIGPNVSIMPGTTVGKHCKIYPGAVIGAEPQDLKYAGEITTVTIGDHTTIRECVTINRGTTDKFTTVVGNHTLLMAYVHVAHDCVVGDHCVLANTVQLGGHVEVGDHAILGGMVGVHQFVKIGKHAIIAAGSVARKDVPPFVTAAREPLSYCGVNSIGLRRRGFTNTEISEIQEIYRLVYLSGLNVSAAAARIEEQFHASDLKSSILSFVTNAERGIIRG